MQFRGLLMAAAALAVLGGLVWWSNKAEANKEKTADPNAPPKLVEIDAAKLQKVEITKNGAVTTLERPADNRYRITSPQPLAADQDAASGVFTALTSYVSDGIVEEKAASLAPFGLDHPTLTVAITRKDGAPVKLLFGDDTPTGGSTYVMKEGDPRVYTVASYNKASLDKSWTDLRDKRLLTFDAEKLSRLELATKGQTIEFGKNNNGEWQIVKPRPLRADGNQVEELLRKLKDAKMDVSLPGGEAQGLTAKFNAAAPAGSAKATDAAGEQTIEVRKDKDGNFYARSSAVEGVHKLSADVGEGFNKTLDDFRNRKLFDFGWTDPGRIDIRDGGALRSFSKAGGKWTSAGKEMDSTSVQSLVDKLRELSAVKFPEKGSGEPTLEATVASADGKRTEKVIITKSGNSYFGTREGEPSLYELDGKLVEELRHAAADVKAAQPAKEQKK
ncbi:MAG: DUF4340 domain-containing protein [Bryobacterales bacterium]|nr:DUF4340 domain-containing protein [Bryobacterales bacterium]